MTTIVYMIRVDGIPRYVGSSQLGATYVRRQKNHRQTKAWLKNVELSRVSFDMIEECEDDKRYELEHFYWSILMTEGFQLENKRDPINAWPLTDRKEAAAIGVETKRRNGTIGNGGRATFSNLSKEAYVKSIETRKTSGSLKRTYQKNKAKLIASTKTPEANAKRKKSIDKIVEDRKLIMKKFDVLNHVANEIRWISINHKVSCEIAYLIHLCTS